MGYHIVNLLMKLQDFEHYSESFYTRLSRDQRVDQNFALKNTAVILAAEENRHAHLFQELLDGITDEITIPLDKELVGEVDYFLIMLKQSVLEYGIMSARQLIAQAVDCENKQVFLITKILNTLELQPGTEKLRIVFQQILKEEQQHVQNLQPFL